MGACRICDALTSTLGTGQFLGRYTGKYECCSVCGFTFIRDPYWLDEAYSSAITTVDIGSVYRCDLFSGLLKTLIHTYTNPQAQFVDYGAGYGLLVRRMRDLGYDYYWHDQHCENLFATGFEAAQQPVSRYALLSAFEVFEHLLDPVTEMEHMTQLADQIVFSTEMISRPPPAPGAWWYYGPEHGQHISFYTWGALNRLARRFSLHFVTNGKIHMFTKRRISKQLFSIVSKPYVSRMANAFLWKQSLLQQDFQEGRNRLIENQTRLQNRSELPSMGALTNSDDPQ